MEPSLYPMTMRQTPQKDPLDTRLRQTMQSYRDNLHTKEDIRLLQFDKQQIKMFKKIRNVKSSLEQAFRLDQKMKSTQVTSSARRLKSIQMQQDRNSDIKRENTRLYKNITTMFNGTPGQSSPHLERNASQSSLGSQSSRSSARRQGSLNYGRRLRENQRLQSENHRMLRKLQSEKSHIDIVKFQIHSDKHDRLLGQMQSRDKHPVAFIRPSGGKLSRNSSQKSLRRNSSSKREIPPQTVSLLKSPRLEASGHGKSSLIQTVRTGNTFTDTNYKLPKLKQSARAYELPPAHNHYSDSKYQSASDQLARPRDKYSTMEMNDYGQTIVGQAKIRNSQYNQSSQSVYGVNKTMGHGEHSTSKSSLEERKFKKPKQSVLLKRHASVQPISEPAQETELLHKKHKIDGLRYDVSVLTKGTKCIFICTRQGKVDRLEVFNKQALRWLQIMSGRHYPDLHSVPAKSLQSLLKLLRQQYESVFIDDSMLITGGVETPEPQQYQTLVPAVKKQHEPFSITVKQ